MKIKVIEIIKDGKIGYLASVSIFGSSRGGKPVVDSPINAINYNLSENSEKLEEHIWLLQVQDSNGGAMSGVQADIVTVVDFEIIVNEFSREEKRRSK